MRPRSLRGRLVLASTVVVALALILIGAIIQRNVGAGLNATIDQALLSRSQEVTALIAGGSTSALEALERVSNEEDDFAQVLTPSGRVVVATPQVRGTPVLDRRTLAAAMRRQVSVERAPLPELDGRVRVTAVPVDSGGRRRIVVVGTTLAERDATLQRLRNSLLIGGTITLLVVSLVVYLVATATLRPVESMRARAAAMTPGHPEVRLPVPGSGDEIERLGRTLNSMLDRIDAAFERERTFVTDASHELRTPLGILKAEVDLALRRSRTEAERIAALRSISNQTGRLVRLAEDLLVLARSDEGQMPLVIQQLDAAVVGAAAVERVRPLAAARGLVVDAETEPALVFEADRRRIEQVLDNLLDNAIRYASASVLLTIAQHGQEVALCVTDDGPGFDEVLRASAFERFARGSDRESSGGAGLGLAIVRAIAAAHGGSTGISERPGGGAAVTVVIPRRRRPAGANAVRS